VRFPWEKGSGKPEPFVFLQWASHSGFRKMFARAAKTATYEVTDFQ